MDLSSIVPPPPTPCPTRRSSFTPKKRDALILIEASISGKLTFSAPGPLRDESLIASGSIFVYKHDARRASELDDKINWVFVDVDGGFEISRSADSNLTKKTMSVEVGGTLYRLISYYAPWDTVNGRLVPPTREWITFSEELAAQEDPGSLSRMEKLRLRMEALGRQKLQTFIQDIAFLTFNWTDENSHEALLHRSRQLLFPIIPSSQEYWNTLCRSAVFEGKTPDQLAHQMESLLSMLLEHSFEQDVPQGLKPSPGFTPLQNISIYMKAFGVEESPLEAFQPLDTEKLTRSLGRSPLFAGSEDMNTQKIQLWDSRMQHSLPIKSSKNSDLTPVFTTLLTRLSTTAMTPVRQRIGVLHKAFPRFEKSENTEFVLLHASYWFCVDEEFRTMLCSWTETKHGERFRHRMLETFRRTLAPEELALILADMAILWCLNPPVEENPSRSSVTSLLDLVGILSRPDILEESWDLLQGLHQAFCRAASSLDEREYIAIMQFLDGSMGIDEKSPAIEELRVYFVERLKGKKHDDALPTDFAGLDRRVDSSGTIG